MDGVRSVHLPVTGKRWLDVGNVEEVICRASATVSLAGGEPIDHLEISTDPTNTAERTAGQEAVGCTVTTHHCSIAVAGDSPPFPLAVRPVS
jgi:hypothetical protein